MRSISSFEKLDSIGEGTYGIVYKGRDIETGRIVALKKVKIDQQDKDGIPLTSLREIQILKEIKHPNIVSLLEVVSGGRDKIYLVFEYLEHDVASLIDNISKPFKLSEIKCFLLQLLRSIEYLHSHWIIHRDLKCSNLLYGNSGILKLGDFGLARKFGYPIESITPNVVTLWYRAPELLLDNSGKYSTAVDIWSIGAIFGELLIGRPLIAGSNEIDQIMRIFKLLGEPNERIWPGYSTLPMVKKLNIPYQPYSNLKDRVSNLSDNGYDLLNKLLTYDPNKRITASEALKHDFFFESPFPQSIEMMPSFPIISKSSLKQQHHHTTTTKTNTTSNNNNNNNNNYKNKDYQSHKNYSSSSSSKDNYKSYDKYDKYDDGDDQPFSRYDYNKR